MSTIFKGGIADSGRGDSMNALEGDTWLADAGRKLGGWDEILEQEQRIERVAQGLATPIAKVAPDREAIATLMLADPDADVLDAARRAVDSKREDEARSLVAAALDSARSRLRLAARAWVGAHEGDLCSLLHAERSSTAARIRDLVADLGGVGDVEAISRRPDLASVMQQLVPVVDEWRLLRRRHLAVTGINLGRIAQTAGSDTLRRFPHLDWASDYDDTWPDFYRMFSRIPMGEQPFPWDDGSTLDVALLLNAFPRVWTPTSGEYERAQAQLSRHVERLVTIELRDYEARAAKGFPSGVQPQQIVERLIRPPEDLRNHELAHSSRMD